jgi:hypothetical protein
MKNLKTLLIVLLTNFAFNISSAQVTLKVYPKHGTVVTKVVKPKIIKHNTIKYYVADGVLYKKKKNKYIVVSAANGVVIKRLPKGYKVVTINGKTFYRYRGVFYKKQRRKFVIVNV